jgi:hypothetical protein
MGIGAAVLVGFVYSFFYLYAERKVGEKGDIALSVIPYKIERYFLWAGSLRKYRTFIITPRPLKAVWFCEVERKNGFDRLCICQNFRGINSITATKAAI